MTTTFDVLGPLRVVTTDGTEINLPGHLQRRLLAGLLLHRGRVVSVDRLTDLVWPDGDAPEGSAALQSLVFRLRQRVPGLDVTFRPPGYVMQVDDEALTSVRFEGAVHEAVAIGESDPERAVKVLDEALALWRGEAYDDLIESDDGRIEIERLDELRLRAFEERFEMRLALGQAAEIVADIEAFVARHPLRERPRHMLIDALDATGRRAEALRVFDAYRRLLAEQLGVAPSVTLRARHERLLEQDDDPTPAPADRRRRSTRRASSNLVGRERVVDEIDRLIDAARLVTLIGPGGVGKTRLALEACDRAGERLQGGAVFCDLTAATSGDVIDVVIDAVGIEWRAGQDPVERLSDVLRHEPVLLVLDNCEHVIDEAADVAERLLRATERLVIVATTRERLAIEGEHLVAVSPLTAGGEDAPAVRLFLDRARAVAPGFEPTDANLELVRTLCRRLDGLPLAIELAAARLQALRLDEILDGLDQSLAVLRGGRRTVDRHRSVEAALQWSVDLLSPEHRQALHAAAMFSGAFDAAELAIVLGIDGFEARERLAALVERSIAGRQPGGRFELLDIVRRFTRERMDASEATSLAAGYAAAVRNKAVELSEQFVHSRDDSPVVAFLSSLTDFRAVVAQSLSNGDIDTAIVVATSLRDLALNTLSPDLMRLAAEVAVAASAIDHPLTADAYAMAAQGAWKRGDLAEMRELVAAAEAEVDRLGLGDRYDVLGTSATEDLAYGRMTVAADRYRRGNLTPEAVDNPLRLAQGGATMSICMAYAHMPDAVETADRLLEQISVTGGSAAVAWCSYAAGETRLADDPESARALLSRAVEAARAGGSSFVEAVAGASLASLDVRLGDTAAAIETYRWLLPLWMRAGVRSPFWTAMRWVARLLIDTGQLAEAARLVGAIEHPAFAHRDLGDDAEHIAGMRRELIDALGDDGFVAAAQPGVGLDDAAATELVMTAFDAVSNPGV